MLVETHNTIKSYLGGLKIDTNKIICHIFPNSTLDNYRTILLKSILFRVKDIESKLECLKKKHCKNWLKPRLAKYTIDEVTKFENEFYQNVAGLVDENIEKKHDTAECEQESLDDLDQTLKLIHSKFCVKHIILKLLAYLHIEKAYVIKYIKQIENTITPESLRVMNITDCFCEYVIRIKTINTLYTKTYSDVCSELIELFYIRDVILHSKSNGDAVNESVVSKRLSELYQRNVILLTELSKIPDYLKLNKLFENNCFGEIDHKGIYLISNKTEIRIFAPTVNQDAFLLDLHDNPELCRFLYSSVGEKMFKYIICNDLTNLPLQSAIKQLMNTSRQKKDLMYENERQDAWLEVYYKLTEIENSPLWRPAKYYDTKYKIVARSENCSFESFEIPRWNNNILAKLLFYMFGIEFLEPSFRVKEFFLTSNTIMNITKTLTVDDIKNKINYEDMANEIDTKIFANSLLCYINNLKSQFDTYKYLFISMWMICHNFCLPTSRL